MFKVDCYSKEVFEALWKELGPHAKERLTFNLRQLLKLIDTGRDGELAVIELCLSPAVCHPEPAVHAMIGTLFMKILRKGSIEVILEIKALADKASEDSDKDMAGSDSSVEKTVHSGLGGNDSDITMGGSDESTSDVSMQDASNLAPIQSAPNPRVTGRINRPDY